MATKRKPRIDGIMTKEAILASAKVEFAEKGFELASVREICRRAGANIALANRYFGSKEDLYRLVAKSLFGDLGKPMSGVAEAVKDKAGWREAVRAWVCDLLSMTIPTEKPQRLCCGLFRHEVANPTKFHSEFVRAYGEPVYRSLYNLIAKVERDPVRIDLWTSSIWSQISVYALADKSWQKSFRPKGVSDESWRNILADFICENVFKALDPSGRKAS